MTSHPNASRPPVVRRPDVPLVGMARVPRDKSIGRRALLFASLAEGLSRIGVVVPSERASSMIDGYPLLAVAAAFATGETRLGETRAGQGDRLAGTVALLEADDVPVRVERDDMILSGRQAGGRVRTPMDHRLAMSALAPGLAARYPVTVDDVGQVGTGLPAVVGLMNRLGAGLADVRA